MGVLTGSKPRSEVLEGDLDDAIFAADFGDLIAGRAPAVYGDPQTFFTNTYPTQQLGKVVQAVFSRLADPSEAGALLRLSTGFGGGKTHTLMTLWHLATNIDNARLGTEVLPAAGRPARVHLAAVDGHKAGNPVFADRDHVQTRSLWGELAYQLGGADAWLQLKDVDHPESQPTDTQFSRILPSGPTLFLLDELVVYMATLSDAGKGNLLSFLQKLMSICANQPNKVLVVSDPAGQAAYANESQRLSDALSVEAQSAIRLDETFGRRMSDFDPIGDEAAQVIQRRLFESTDSYAAQTASHSYFTLYDRMNKEDTQSLPSGTARQEYAKQFVASYPFHPRLMKTAQERLGAMQDFQQSRGTLRLFARIIRSVWEHKHDVEVISAGEINWGDQRIRGELISRLNRDNFAAAISADVEGHAVELDGDNPRGIHRRVASALLLESLPLQSNSGLDAPDLTLAVVRPEEAGHEPAEAMERLFGVCWHTYPMEGGRGWQFRYEPNVVKQIEERISSVPMEDARQRVLGEVQSYFSGPTFRTSNWPTRAQQVSENANLTLVLAESEETARSICMYSDDENRDAPMPRRFINSIVGVAPTPSAFQNAIERARRLIATESIEQEYSQTPDRRLVATQLRDLKTNYQRQMRLQACRAFNIVVTHDRDGTLDEKYQVTPEDVLGSISGKGQGRIRAFLEEKDWIYGEADAFDLERFTSTILQGAIPVSGESQVWTARQIHERVLGAPGLRLVPGAGIVTRTLSRAVREGALVVRTADGTVYDHEGAVTGPDHNRRRNSGMQPTTFSLHDDGLVARPSTERAAGWLTVTPEVKPGDDDDDNPTIPSPPPPPGKRETTTNWLTAVDMAGGRNLLEVTLKTSTPELASYLIQTAQPLGAVSMRLDVMARGTIRETGDMAFQVRNVAHNHPTKPLELARTLYTACDRESRAYEATLHLEFGKEGRAGMSSVLQQASSIANAHGLGFEARFERADGCNA